MIVELTKDSLKFINELEHNFSTIFSSENTLIHDFESNTFTKYFIYIENSNIIGFINYYDLYDRFEVANIYVMPEYRNRKIASKLIEHIIKLGKEKNIYNVTLEVRIDNEYALKLYKKYEFKTVAIRKNYYDGIDGLLMERKMM